MNRKHILTLVAARTGRFVEAALHPEYTNQALAESLRELAQGYLTMANALEDPTLTDAKLFLLQQELEQRVGVLTERGPLETMPHLARTGLPASRTQS